MKPNPRPAAFLLSAATALALSLTAPASAQDDPATQADTDTAEEVTLGAPPADDPLAPGRADPAPVRPRDLADAPHVAGILGIPSARYEVDPRVLGVAPGEPLPNLRREGEFLRDQPGRLLTADERGYAVFVFEPDPEAGIDRALAVVVAPNRALESMEELVKRRGEPVGFTVSGQVHTYRGVNYLMITAPPQPWLEHVPAAPADPAGTGSGEAEAQDAAAPAVVEDTPEPDAAQADPDTAGPLTPEEELAELLRQQGSPGSRPGPGNQGTPRTPGNPSTPGTRPASAGGDAPRLPDIPRGGGAVDPAVVGIAPGQATAELVDEGAFVVRRTGRLVRSGDGSHALFIFDNADDAPMILQACRLLEQMEQVVHQRGDHLPLVVTGQVQTYRGANYLLPTILRQEFERGNLE